MQSLQMRWPVAAIIGLSMAMVAKAPSTLPWRAQRVHFADLLVQRAAGQGHAERRFLELRRSCGPSGPCCRNPCPGCGTRCSSSSGPAPAGWFMPVIGQREAVALPPVVLGQAQHGDAVALDRLDRHQVLGVDPVRHAEQRAAAMRGAAGRRSASPRRRSAARGRAPRRRRPLPRRRRAVAKAGSVSGSPIRASSAARSAGPSKPDGSGYFFTAWRCTNSRLQACIGSSAAGPPRQRQQSPPRCRTVSATKPSRCGPSATTSSLSSFAASASGVGARGSRRACRPASSAARRSRNARSSRTSPSRSARSAKLKPKPSGGSAGR